MKTKSRRTFIRQSAAGVSAVALGIPYLESLANVEKKELPGIALQLWTVRNELEKDLDGTLNKVKSTGFNTVETAFFPEKVSVRQAGEALRKAGLKVSSMHVELPVGKQQQIWLETAQAYGCKRMIWHGWPETGQYKTMDGIKQLADSYNAANAFAKANGLQFGLHNHWWEMTAYPDGRLPLAVLAESIDNDIFFEVDTYWTRVAGQDPARVVSQFANRTLYLHIKDGPGKTPDDSMVAVGTGVQDFPAIAKAAANVEWMVVEFDKCDSDIFEALKRSIDYLLNKGIASR